MADLHRIKPLNKDLLLKILRTQARVVTLEEHSITGGIGSSLCELVMDHGINLSLQRFALEDRTCTQYGTREWMHSWHGIDVQSLGDRIGGAEKELNA